MSANSFLHFITEEETGDSLRVPGRAEPVIGSDDLFPEMIFIFEQCIELIQGRVGRLRPGGTRPECLYYDEHPACPEIAAGIGQKSFHGSSDVVFMLSDGMAETPALNKYVELPVKPGQIEIVRGGKGDPFQIRCEAPPCPFQHV